MKSRVLQMLSHWRDVFYNKYYPLTIINRNKCRSRNKKHDFTLLAGNCMGGYIYHQLGLKFSSPTINLMIYDDDFFRLVCNPHYYLSLEFTPYTDPQYPNVPSGKLNDVIVHFTHYKSFEEGVNFWNKRKIRIDWNNLYIIAADMRLSDEQIAAYANVKCKKLVVFTSKKYDFPYCLHIKRFDGQPHVGPYIGKTYQGKWIFEQFFDYVGWLNSDDLVAQHFSLEE